MLNSFLLVRKPHEVVASYLRKGWYDKPFVRSNPDLPPTTQDCELFHHFLGRIVPSGEKFTVWQNMSRVGKLAWYWNALNAKVIEQFSHIPADRWRNSKARRLFLRAIPEHRRFLRLQAYCFRQAV